MSSSITETINLEYIHPAKVSYKNEDNKRIFRFKKKKKKERDWHETGLQRKENPKRWTVRQKEILRWKTYNERKIKHKALHTAQITTWVKTPSVHSRQS